MDYLNTIYNSNVITNNFIASPYTSDITAGHALVLGLLLMIMIVIITISFIISVIGLWKMYTKAGEKGWKSLIPIYNIVILYKIAGLSPLLLLLFLLVAIPIIGTFFAGVAGFVLTILLGIKLSRSFGKGSGYAVGLIFLPTLFYLILGFGNAKYVGPDGIAETKNTNSSNDDKEATTATTDEQK